MGHTKLDMLIDDYLGDMQRRARTDESVSINQVAFMAPPGEARW